MKKETTECLWATLGLAALVSFFFRRAVFEGQTLFVRDINMVWLPQVEVFVRCIASGSWPVWDPYRGFGQPLLADPRAEVLYPITWLNLVLPPWAYYTVFVVIHLLLAGIGLYALARQWQASAAASFAAAAVWVGSGPLLSLASVWHHLAAAAWIPWVFLGAERALARPAVTSTLLWGGATAVQILAGSPDITVLTLAALGLGILAHHVPWRQLRGAQSRRLIVATSCALVLALGATAAQWLPTLEVARRSERWNLPYEDRTTWSLHPVLLTEALVPFRWVDLPLLPAWVSTLLESKEPWLHSIYLGGPAAALAMASAALGIRRRKFLIGVVVAAAAAALGRHTPVYGALVSLMPPFRMLRFPVKAMVLASFAWSLLVGMGVDVCRGGDSRSRRGAGVVAATALAVALFDLTGLLIARHASAALDFLLRPLPSGAWEGLAPSAQKLTTSGALCAAMAAVAWAMRTRSARWQPFLLAALVVGDLMLAHRNLHPVAPRALFSYRPEVLRLLVPSPHPRVYAYDYSTATRGQLQRGTHPGFLYRLHRLPVGWPPAAALVLGVHMYLNPPTAARWGIHGSYDLDILGFYPRPIAEIDELLRDAEASPLHLRLLQMGSVANALALHPQPWWRGLEPTGSVDGLFEEPIHVFSVPDPLPRTFAVGGARIADGAAALRLLSDPSLRPSREVILPEGEASVPAEGFRGSSTILEYEPDHVRLEAQLSDPGYVVLVDGWDAGWRATVDGVATPLLRANVAFRAVRVTAGHHVIDYSYRPPGLAAGLLISTVSLAIAALAALRAVRASA